MNVLLIGATGFIGSNIVGPLHSTGLRIFQYQRPGGGGRASLGELPLVSHENMFGANPPRMDAIVSVAGCGNPAVCEEYPAQSLRAEIDLMDLVSRLAVRASAAAIVHLSSAGAVYGEGWNADASKRRIFSEDSHCEPLSSYGRIKLESEQRLTAQSTGDRAVAILRASNVYGLRYEKGGRQGLINALAERSLKNQPITIFGDGEIYRDYLFSDDLATAIISALENRANGIFNVAKGESHSILQVVGCLESLLGRELVKVTQPTRGFDVKYSALSIERAKRVLFWEPSVDLRAGVTLALSNLGWLPTLG